MRSLFGSPVLKRMAREESLQATSSNRDRAAVIAGQAAP